MKRSFVDYHATAFPVAACRSGRHDYPRPTGEKEPADVRVYAELRDLFRDLVYASDVKVVVLTGAGGNFCSGGDVHEIIGPLTEMTMPRVAGLHAHDGRSGQGYSGLPTTDYQRGRRHLRGSRRDSGDGIRPALWHTYLQDGLLIHPRRAGRL